MFDLDFSPPQELNISLWRSLLINFADRFAPERLPPLQLTSKPVDVGILNGDLLSLPWYRTVFTNLGDVISPETLPPLELTSQPVDVGELLVDELSHPWWDSLLQSVRDRLSPEKLAPLHLTSQPVTAFGAESSMQILDWSTLISGPKVFYADEPRPEAVAYSYDQGPVLVTPAAVEQEHPGILAARLQLTRDIGRTRFRRKIWISFAAAEAIFLLVALFKFT